MPTSAKVVNDEDLRKLYRKVATLSASPKLKHPLKKYVPNQWYLWLQNERKNANTVSTNDLASITVQDENVKTNDKDMQLLHSVKEIVVKLRKYQKEDEGKKPDLESQLVRKGEKSKAFNRGNDVAGGQELSISPSINMEELSTDVTGGQESSISPRTKGEAPSTHITEEQESSIRSGSSQQESVSKKESMKEGSIRYKKE